MFRIVVLSAFLAAAFAEDAATVATRCVNNAGDLPLSFQIEGCSSAPCLLPQLEDAVMNIKFNAPHNSDTLRTQLVAYIIANLGITIDIGSDSQACSGLNNASCPVKESDDLDYTLKLHIEPFFLVNVRLRSR